MLPQKPTENLEENDEIPSTPAGEASSSKRPNQKRNPELPYSDTTKLEKNTGATVITVNEDGQILQDKIGDTVYLDIKSIGKDSELLGAELILFFNNEYMSPGRELINTQDNFLRGFPTVQPGWYADSLLNLLKRQSYPQDLKGRDTFDGLRQELDKFNTLFNQKTVDNGRVIKEDFFDIAEMVFQVPVSLTAKNPTKIIRHYRLAPGLDRNLDLGSGLSCTEIANMLVGVLKTEEKCHLKVTLNAVRTRYHKSSAEQSEDADLQSRVAMPRDYFKKFKDAGAEPDLEGFPRLKKLRDEGVYKFRGTRQQCLTRFSEIMRELRKFLMQYKNKYRDVLKTGLKNAGEHEEIVNSILKERKKEKAGAETPKQTALKRKRGEVSTITNEGTSEVDEPEPKKPRRNVKTGGKNEGEEKQEVTEQTNNGLQAESRDLFAPPMADQVTCVNEANAQTNDLICNPNPDLSASIIKLIAENPNRIGFYDPQQLQNGLNPIFSFNSREPTTTQNFFGTETAGPELQGQGFQNQIFVQQSAKVGSDCSDQEDSGDDISSLFPSEGDCSHQEDSGFCISSLLASEDDCSDKEDSGDGICSENMEFQKLLRIPLQ